jgi:hypothetical protein
MADVVLRTVGAWIGKELEALQGDTEGQFAGAGLALTQMECLLTTEEGGEQGAKEYDKEGDMKQKRNGTMPHAGAKNGIYPAHGEDCPEGVEPRCGVYELVCCCGAIKTLHHCGGGKNHDEHYIDSNA